MLSPKNNLDSRIHAAGCALVLLACALLTKPYVEMGISDDFSYIRSAQMLAQTGHIVYNGWAATPLGWLLYAGALFIKLFGFSFTVVRASNVTVALLCTYLLHRVMTNSGLSASNATLGTLTVALSPVWLMLELNFMTDAGGLFGLCLCLYLCQRSILSRNDRRAVCWLWLAALSNMAAGTVRQTTWLGVLVMVPATAWMLRRRRGMLASGLIAWVIGVVSVLAFLHWYAMQPLSVPETVSLGGSLFNLVRMMARSLLTAVLLALPVLMLAPASLWDLPRRTRMRALGAVLLVIVGVIGGGWLFATSARLPTQQFLPPWLGDNLTMSGVKQANEIAGRTPLVLRPPIQVAILAAVLISMFSLVLRIALAKRVRRQQERPDDPSPLTWKQMGWLLLPFAAAYGLLLIPRASTGKFFDRYLLPLVMVAIIPLLRYAQERCLQPRRWLAWATLTVFSMYAVAATHDLFSFDRARVEAAEQVTRSGVPRTSLEGGFEYDAWTQILETGSIPDPATQTGPNAGRPDKCRGFFSILAPVVRPDYMLSFDPNGCFTESHYPAVPYSVWLPPYGRAIHIQRVK